METGEPELTPMVVGYLLRGSKVLLGERKQSTWGLGLHLIAGIGGKVGDLPGLEHETPEEALAREMAEEIGVVPTSYRAMGQLTFLFPQKPTWNQQVEVYTIDAWEGEPVETAAIQPGWYEVQALPFDHMWDDSRYYLPDVLSGRAVRATFVYGPDNRTVAEKHVEYTG